MPEDRARFERWGESSVRNLLQAIEDSRSVGLRRALVGWSIPLTSDGTAKRICRHGYRSIEQLQAASVEELCEVDDVGPVVAHALREFHVAGEDRGFELPRAARRAAPAAERRHGREARRTRK